MTQTEIIEARKALAFVDLDILGDLIEWVRELIARREGSHVDSEKLVRDLLVSEYGASAEKAEQWVGALLVLAKAPRRVH